MASISENVASLATRIGTEFLSLKDTYATKSELDTLSVGGSKYELELTTPITAGDVVTVPSYTVGAATLNIYVAGMRCVRGDTFSEIGTDGDTATTVTFNDDISSSYDVVAVVG